MFIHPLPDANCQDQGTFGLMARNFWCAFSANARFASETLRDRLLEQVSTKHGKMWHHDKIFKHVWHEQYTGVIDDYCSTIETFTELYNLSPAGKAFGMACHKARRTSKGLPVFNQNCLREFGGHQGITWGIAELSELFSPLKEVAETERLNHHVFPDALHFTDVRLKLILMDTPNGLSPTLMILLQDPRIAGFVVSPPLRTV